MHPESGISARLLAPAALAVCAVLFLFVLLSSGGGGESGQGSEQAGGSQTQSTAPQRTRTRQGRRPRGDTYTVKTGDNLGRIAERTGVEIERLQELNPQLDPQALVAGQKLKLRE